MKFCVAATAEELSGEKDEEDRREEIVESVQIVESVEIEESEENEDVVKSILKLSLPGLGIV